MKTTFSFLLHVLLLSNVNAQSSSIDKNKVLDFFQNQQFDEAISYVSPAASIDSQNIQLHSYLGYAYYMNDNYDDAEKHFLQAIHSKELTPVF